MKYLAEKIEKYLVSECSDEWHVKYEKNKITAYYTSEKRFEIVYDNDFEEWYFILFCPKWVDKRYCKIENKGEKRYDFK